MNTKMCSCVTLATQASSITKQYVEQVEVQVMLGRGIIDPCQSCWSSRVVLVTKNDGSTRFFMDYRKVNEVTAKMPIHYPG